MTLGKTLTNHVGTASGAGGAALLLLEEDPVFVALGIALMLGSAAIGAFRYWAKLKYSEGVPDDDAEEGE